MVKGDHVTGHVTCHVTHRVLRVLGQFQVHGECVRHATAQPATGGSRESHSVRTYRGVEMETDFSFVAPSSGELGVRKEIMPYFKHSIV